MKIMIVDDEKPIRQWFEFILKKIENVEIVGLYPNGKAALEACSVERPDVIFTDIIMPVMDGIEEITAVKQQYPEIAIVILSNYDDFEYVYKGLKLGAEDYLLKSQADEEQILEVIRQIKKKNFETDMPEITTEVENRLVAQMKEYILQEYRNSVKLSDAAQKFHYHPDYLSTLFKKETGKNFNAYLTEVRMEKAKELLGQGNLKIREIAEAVGYANEMYFSTAFKKYAGISPKQFIS